MKGCEEDTEFQIRPGHEILAVSTEAISLLARRLAVNHETFNETGWNLMSVMSTTSAIDDRISTEFVTANGLRYEVDMCWDQSSKTLAICLHWFPEHPVSSRYHLPMSAANAYKVLASILRGYGNSSITSDQKDYAIENLIADVADLIDATPC